MHTNRRKARIEVLTLFLLFIAFGMGTVALGNLPSNQSPAPTIQSPPTGTTFDHVVIIMMENEGLQNICAGNPPPCTSFHSSTPYLSGLATNYTVAQRYDSVIRPITSQPNYVAIIGGSTFSCPSNCSNINAPTLIDRLQTNGLSWKGYFENMGQTTGCVTGGSSPYNSSHNPFIPFKEFVNSGVSNATMCNKLVLANPSGCGTVTDCTLVNDLNNVTGQPNFMWLTPNDCNNMHAASGCSNGCTSGGSDTCISDGDKYLKSLVPSILNSRAFTTGRSALYITFDEGQDFCPYNGSSSEDCVYANWAGPEAKNGFVAPSSHLYNHYSFLHTVETNWSLATLTSNDAGAMVMSEFFKAQAPDFTNTPSPASVSFPAGGSGNSTITLQSINSFTGTITLTKSGTPTGLTLSLNPTSVTLSAGQSKTSLLTISSSTLGTYTATVTGTSGSLVHNATITVSVTGPPDFSISANPSSLTLGQVSTGASNPVTISPTGDRTVFESSYLANSFYAKGLYWLFYEDSQNTCEHIAGCLEYTTSLNGSSWATPTIVPVHITDSVFSVYTDGSNVFYARYNDTTFENLCGKNLQFREGALSTSGTVTWQPEQTILHASSTRLYANLYVTLDSNGQAWVGYVTDLHGACGGNGADSPQVVHSSGTNYASWTGFFNLTLNNSGNWHVALASIGSGQIFASYWIVNTDVRGRLYNGSWQSEEQISSTSTLADVNSWLFNSGTNLYMIYFDDSTETYNFASRSSTGTWTDHTIGNAETHTGTGFNPNYYSLPDAASYDSTANTFDLFYMNSTTQKVDEWTGSGGNWTKTIGIIKTGAVPYADSITSFITSTTQTNGALFYIGGSSSPFSLNEATLTFTANGSTGQFQTIITPINSFTGTVSLTTTVSPSTGLNVTCNPAMITGGSGISTCTVNSSTAGNYTITIKGTSGSLNHSTTVNVTVPGSGPNFTITASAPAPANTGASTTTTITITAVGGFTGTVALTNTVPSGLVCGSITPNSITGSGTATVTCHSAMAGNYTLTVKGTSGSLVHSANATFRIQDFAISSTSPVTVNAGSNGTTTVTITALNGFVGTTTLADTIPTGLICGTITPTSIIGSGTATIACNSNTAGNYTLTITGTSASLVHTAMTLFIVQNFTITATSPSAANVSQSAISTITITSQNHFIGVVTLTDTIPTGLSCGSITPGSLTGSGSATVSCSATIAGNYTLTITAKNGSLAHNATATFRFQDYTIIASTPITINAGSSATTNVTITSLNHFGGTVTITDTVPSGLTCGTITPSSITGSGTATIACNSSTAGNYTLTVTGTSTSLVHSTTVLFIIQNFTITATSPAAIDATQSAVSTINLTAQNHFAGTITLSDTIPTGLSCGTITPGTVTGSGTATVSCSSIIAGNYTLTITAKNGQLVHTTTATFRFQDYTISLSTLSTVDAGVSSTLTITIGALNHFAGTVTLSGTIPSGLTCGGIIPTSLTGSGIATVNCTATIAGNYSLTVTANSSPLSHGLSATFSFVDFSINAISPVSGNAKSSLSTTITVSSLNGFTSAVSLTDQVPSGLTCGALTPTSISGGSGTATISCNASIAGNYTLTITGTSSPLSHNTTVLFEIQDFTITAVNPGPVVVYSSSNITITITAVNRFAGTVSLTDTIPIGLSCASINPNMITAAGSASLVCSTYTAGNYTLTVMGTSNNLSHSIIEKIQVVDFSLTVPGQIIQQVGNNSTTALTLTSLNGFSGNVTLSVGIQNISSSSNSGGSSLRSPLKLAPPSGSPIISLTPTSLILTGSKQSNLTIVLSSTVPAGNYLIVITAAGPGITRTIQTTLAATDFTINSSNNNPTISMGGNSTLTLTIQSLNGYQGNLTLTWTIAPSGPNATITPTIVYLTSTSTIATMTILVPSNSPAGNYTLTVQASSGTLSHTLIITVDVPPTGMTTTITRILTSNNLLVLKTVGLVLTLSLVPLGIVRRGRGRRASKSRNLSAVPQFYRTRRITYNQLTILPPLRIRDNFQD